MRQFLQGGRRALLAAAPALVLGLVGVPDAAQAQPVTSDRQAQIRPGMTMDEVTAAIGKPYKIRKYKDGATWGYQTRQTENWFLVDFGADGKVKQAKQQYISAF